MLTWLFGAICIVLTLYVTISRVAPIRLVLGYATTVDVVFTGGMIYLFHDSVTGLMSATVAGLVLACSLTVSRWLVGYQRLSIAGRKLRIVDTPGKLHSLGMVVKHVLKTFTAAIKRQLTVAS